jgi:hypothetical protein
MQKNYLLKREAFLAEDDKFESYGSGQSFEEPLKEISNPSEPFAVEG